MSRVINDYLPIARSLAREQFLERYPEPVLLQRSSPDSLAPREEYGNTQKMRIDPSTKELRIEQPLPSPLESVVPVAKAERNSFASQVLVGRTDSNDLVVAHLTVSKHHAFFRLDETGGHYTLTDMDSTNGTRVNGQALVGRQPRPLDDGDLVAFGDMNFIFYTAGGFYDLLTSLSALR
jgi:hypothetical protein